MTNYTIYESDENSKIPLLVIPKNIVQNGFSMNPNKNSSKTVNIALNAHEVGSIEGILREETYGEKYQGYLPIERIGSLQKESDHTNRYINSHLNSGDIERFLSDSTEKTNYFDKELISGNIYLVDCLFKDSFPQKKLFVVGEEDGELSCQEGILRLENYSKPFNEDKIFENYFKSEEFEKMSVSKVGYLKIKRRSLQPHLSYGWNSIFSESLKGPNLVFMDENDFYTQYMLREIYGIK